jgi:hypothetical protein
MSHHLLGLALVAVAAVPGALRAQAPVDQRTWSRTFGGPVSEQGLHDVRQLAGGRLVAAGYTASFGGPTQASWLLGLDLATGDVRVQHASTSASGGFTDGASVAADGGALFLGRDVLDIFLKHDAWLVRVDGLGRPVWSVGFTRPGAGKHFLFDAAELRDGSWIAVGATSLTDQPPQAAWIVRVGADGIPLWHFEYGGGVVETARAVTPTADGGFAVAGWTSSSGAGSDDVWVMKIDATGTPQWQRTFGGLDTDQAEDIIELDDGGFAVAASTNSLTASGHAPWILRLDSAGELRWHAVVDGGVWGDLGAVARTQDGQLIVCGRVAETGFPTNDLWGAQLSAADGSIAWQRAYEGALGDFGSAALALETPGLVLGGTWAWGFGGESIWLQRTDRTGQLPGCDLVRTTKLPTISPAIAQGAGIAMQAPGGAQVQAVAVKLAPSDAVVIDVCR